MLTSQVIGKAGVAGRVLGLAAVAGLLAGGLALPAVGAVGLTVKSGTDKFNNLPAGTLGSLPIRSQLVGAGGHVLAYFYPRGIDREPVSYDQIAPVMRDAIVAIEDSRFYQHGAIDVKGTVRALVNDLQHKSVQGGSTLTQQYVKNVLILTAPNTQMAQQATTDTISRKIKELRLAIEVEKKQTKNEILADYLNAAFFGTFAGNQAVGIQAAAERYFGTTAAKLTLPEAAMLAGMVENPAQYNPITSAPDAIKRRNVVLARMAQLHYITPATAVQVGNQPLGLHLTPLQTGCTSSAASQAAFFCDYVVAAMQHDKAYSKAWKVLNTTGGLTITSTLNGQDQAAATAAVNYMVPPPPDGANPGGNAAAEVLVQPGTGFIRAIANDRPYGMGPHQSTIDYGVNTQYDGSPDGVQTGSSSKLFVLLTALEQGVPFGFPQTVNTPATVTGFTDCQGQPAGGGNMSSLTPGQYIPVGSYQLINDSPTEKGAFTLYTATAQSVNVYFAMLERKVGLCNVVKTADQLGVTRFDGKSLLAPDNVPGIGHLPPADQVPAFTLGAVNVSPMSMAAAYATVAARGVYCKPIAIHAITTRTGAKLPVESAGCHQAIPPGVADAASYVLQSVLVNGTAGGLGIGRPAAGKTGTSDDFTYAAFGGYTPDLTGYVSVFNPVNAFQHPMSGYPGSCWRGGCSGQMFGADAPAHIWQMTFLHSALANPPANFVMADINPGLWSMGNGQSNPVQKKPGRGGNGGGGNGGGGGGNGGGGPGGGGGGPGGGGTGGGPPTH